MGLVVSGALFMSGAGPLLIRPGMTYAEQAALVAERPTILNRTGRNEVREVEYPRIGMTVTFESGRIVQVNRRNR